MDRFHDFLQKPFGESGRDLEPFFLVGTLREEGRKVLVERHTNKKPKGWNVVLLMEKILHPPVEVDSLSQYL